MKINWYIIVIWLAAWATNAVHFAENPELTSQPICGMLLWILFALAFLERK